MKYVLLILSQVLCVGALAAEQSDGGLMKDFDSLGGNDVLVEKAKALEPDQTMSVVQNRIVDRHLRSEFDVEYNFTAGGDSYLQTKNVGGGYRFHITPHWAVSGRYNYSYNQLTPEAERMIWREAKIPDVDHPKQSVMAVAEWYPIYGKFSLYDLGIIHFDIYLLGGAGQITLESGSTNMYTGGGGLGFWLSQHLTARGELRGQYYKAKNFEGETNMNITVASFMLGYLL